MNNHKSGNLKGGFRLFLLLALLLAGCARKTPVPDTNVSWQNEVKYASECGLDGLRCCTDTQPQCLYNQQCCVNPENSSDDLCADDCTCGKAKNFCCPGEKCDPGLACAGSRCVKCGGADEPCCGNNDCRDDLICYRNKCVACGVAGNPCCSNPPACPVGADTDGQRIECISDLCRYCGSNGNTTCLSVPICDTKQLANNGRCFACGGFNNPCCDRAFEIGYDCDPQSGLVCKLGFCDKQ